jgi:tetratricopeptide (TPR) repeat protein
MYGMKYNVKSILLVVGAMALCVAVACSGSGSTGAGPFDPRDALDNAWDDFAAENYAQALAGFDEVIAHVSDNAEARMGRGWCNVYLAQYDESAYSDGISALMSAIANGMASGDAEMGLAVIYRVLYSSDRSQSEYADSALKYAGSVLEIDSAYTFSRNEATNHLDAHMIKALCYFELGESYFPFAHIEVNLLADIVPQVQPLNDPSTYGPGEYEQAIAHKLQQLSERIDP